MNFLNRLQLYTIMLLACVLISFFVLYPGHVKIFWFKQNFSLPVGIFFIINFVFILCVNGIFFLFKKIISIPKRYKQIIEKKRDKRTKDLVIESLISLSSGQLNEARETIALVQEVSPNEAFSLIIGQKVAHAFQDDIGMEKIYNQMIADPNLSFLGLQGLIKASERKKDWEKSYRLLEEAFLLRPDSPWVLESIKRCHWMFVRGLDTYKKFHEFGVGNRYIEKTQKIQYESGLAWSSLYTLNSQKACENLNRILEHITKSCPNWVVPNGLFILFTPKSLKSDNEDMYKVESSDAVYHHLMKITKKMYESAPHRWIIESFVMSCSAQKSWLDLYQDITKITKNHPFHSETLLVLSLCAVKAQLWGDAKKHITTLINKYPTTIAFDIMAKCSQKTDLAQVFQEKWETIHELINESAKVPYDYYWICQHCSKSFYALDKEKDEHVNHFFSKSSWYDVFLNIRNHCSKKLLSDIQVEHILNWDVLCPHCYSIESLSWKKSFYQGKKRIKDANHEIKNLIEKELMIDLLKDSQKNQCIKKISSTS